MRKICLLLLVVCSVVVSLAQNCASKLSAAQDAEAKKDYKTAAFYYKKIMDDCGENYGNAKAKWKECQNKLNSNKPYDQHVEVKPKPSSPTSPETTLDQYGRVKVSFDAGKATPICENVRNVIKKLENYDTLGLQIEIPWCGDMYSLQLIEKRIRNITEIFIASGIDESRIVSKITMVDVLESCDGLSNDYDHDRIAEHITLINVEDGYNACDSAWLTIVKLPENILFENDDEGHVPIKDISDKLSTTKISFLNYDDTPQMIDVNDNILRIANILKKSNTFRLIIEIYTYATEETPATEEYIRDLCGRRVNHLRDIFIQMGIPQSLIETVTMDVNYSKNPHFPNNIAYIRLVEREVSPKQSEEKDMLSEEDRTDISDLADALSNIKIVFNYGQDIPSIKDINGDMNRVVAILNKNKSLKLILEIHTNSIDTEEHQEDLARRRAYKVRDLFIEKGVSSDQVEKALYAEKDSQNLNKAVVFRIVKR